jgi:thiamine-monophosphate kinase
MKKDIRGLGEFGVIDRIADNVTKGSGITLGIGDDAAATQQTGGLLTLSTTDMLVEGVHFDLTLCDPMTLGKKSLSVNLSDIAAMGGKPLYFLLSLAIPSTSTVEFVDGFTSGLLARAKEFGVTLIGGDTCASPDGTVISITLLGEQTPEKIIGRNGAKPDDFIFVTGTLGDSALGLQLLRKGQKRGKPLCRHLDPTPRVLEGQALAAAGAVTAMIDVSDGLLGDLRHILDKSSVGADLYLERLPLSDCYREHFLHDPCELYSLALSGGEDYELLFTAPPSRREEIRSIFRELGTPVSEIGKVTAAPRLRVVSSNGEILPVEKNGFDHFLRR